MATMAQREVNGQKSDPNERNAKGKELGGNGALSAHEALPQTPPGGKPPETRPPFPGRGLYRTESIGQGYASRAETARP